jgi:hypothetical protein
MAEREQTPRQVAGVDRADAPGRHIRAASLRLPLERMRTTPRHPADAADPAESRYQEPRFPGLRSRSTELGLTGVAPPVPSHRQGPGRPVTATGDPTHIQFRGKGIRRN